MIEVNLTIGFIDMFLGANILSKFIFVVFFVSQSYPWSPKFRWLSCEVCSHWPPQTLLELPTNQPNKSTKPPF